MEMFDAHLHIIAPDFPLTPNQGYLPDFFTVDDHLAQARPLGIAGGAVVSGSFQGTDQTWLLDARQKLGPTFVGVTQLPAGTPDDAILDLHSKGVRAVRFNLQRGGSEHVSELERMARRVHTRCGWHVELYVASRYLADLRDLLARLPKVSIDHLRLTAEGFGDLVWLVERGAHVKATGFGRCNFDVAASLRTLHAANPQALMFGTDLPCPARAPLDRSKRMTSRRWSMRWTSISNTPSIRTRRGFIGGSDQNRSSLGLQICICSINNSGSVPTRMTCLRSSSAALTR